MISKKDLMLRLIDLECLYADMDERLSVLEHPKKKTTRKGKNEVKK